MSRLHPCSDPPTHAIQRPARLLDRRTLLRATAGFVGMATTVGYVGSSVSAQSSTTRASEWNQPAAVGGETEYLGFEADFAFSAVAAHWPGDIPFPASIEISVSDDGKTWSEPVIVGPAHTDAGPIDRDGRIFTELLFTQDASVVRYRGLNADGDVIAIPGLTFTYIDAKAGPSISDFPPNDGAPSASRPPIIGRQDWGAEQAYGGVDRGEVEWTTEYQTVKHVIIHHSETPQFRDPMVEIRSIHYYHALTRGWGDIGYNYLVDYLGNVYEGRAGGDNVVGGHAFQYARGSAGICTMGSFTAASATPETIAGLTWIAAWAA
ncbi:MAG TPA: N-acetylmuramoyl-L-alanine amidase, partial [Thermomicrobiales bacterium]|nr:N-acetylmuramoyl-L-alanine amidase [Thermomicrobiales bacterium]